MIYLVFTQIGFDQIEATILQNKASLWVNDNVLTDDKLARLYSANITVHFLPHLIDPSDEKSVSSAIQHVEIKAPDGVEIFVEYL